MFVIDAENKSLSHWYLIKNGTVGVSVCVSDMVITGIIVTMQ